MKVKKEFLKGKIEPFIYEKLDKEEYELIENNPKELLTWNRLIVAFNLFYLNYKDKINFAKEVYKEMIRATSLGKYIEPGQEYTKNSLDKFFKFFDNTFESIKVHGFDINKTIIPLAKDGSILNGSHRVACSIFLNKKVYCIKTKLEPLVDDWKNLYERNIDIEILEIAIKEFVKWCDNCYIAFLWPSCEKLWNKNKNLFENIIYEKELNLTTNGAYNLLIELYKHMDDWVGKPEDGYPGIKQKLLECFPNNKYNVKIIFFQESSLEKVRKIKEKVRDNCDMGYSSIHITDTKEEAIKISELILNENGIHFLNFAKPYKYYTYNKENINKIKKYFVKNNIELEDVVIDSSMVLSLYGLRRNADIDFLTFDNSKLQYHDEELQYHDEELQYHDEEKNNLIYNPKFYFVYEGVKFISFKQLYKMKKNRAEEKDLNDCEMMKSLISNNFIDKIKAKLIQNIFYFKIKLKSFIWDFLLKILKKIGLYEIVRKIYRKLKGNK